MLIQQILSSSNDKNIENTIRTISTSILLQLIDYLNKYIYQSAEKGLIASKWLRIILTIHSSYLMTLSDITERLSSMYELIESRTILYPKLARLQGKVSLISSQINSHPNDTKRSSSPSLIFEDVSDDDIDGDHTQDELIPSPSEYDDYSGLSDDLDLQNDDDNEDEMNESDTDIRFQDNSDNTNSS